MKSFNASIGVALATLCAGPIFVLPLAVAESWGQGDGCGCAAGIAESVEIALVFTLVSIPAGAIVAMLPNLVGSLLMGWLGCRYATARHWLAWTAAGGVVGAPIGGTAAGAFDGWTAAAYMAGVGAACALLCRTGTSWTED